MHSKGSYQTHLNLSLKAETGSSKRSAKVSLNKLDY